MNTVELSHGRLTALQKILFRTTIVFFVVSALYLTWRAGGIFEADLSPEVSLKGRALARSLTFQVNRALALGIPLPSLVGMNEFFDEFIENHTEVAYVAVTDAQNQVLFIRGVSTEDIRSSLQDQPLYSERTYLIVKDASFYNTRLELQNHAGWLHIGVRSNYVRQRMMEIAADAVIVLFVCVLVAFEVLTLLISAGIKSRINSVLNLVQRIGEGDFRLLAVVRGSDDFDTLATRLNSLVISINDRFTRLQTLLTERGKALPERLYRFKFSTSHTVDFQPALEAIRVPLFLFVLSEELSRSFLPLFARDLAWTMPNLPPDIVVSLPICVYMLIFAVTTPFAGNLADRFGNRKIFMLGAMFSIVGFLWLAMVSTLLQFVLARAVCAAGYSIATIAVQNYLISNAPVGSQARAQALFVGGIMVAGMAGASFGGVLAERIGFRMTFAVAGLVSAIALAVYWSTPDTSEDKLKERSVRRQFRISDLWDLLRNKPFIQLILFSAIPAKILLAGFLFYLTPLYLLKLGYSQSDIGRSVMMYFLLVYFGNYLSSWVADRFLIRRSLMVAGGLISGLGLLSIFIVPVASHAILVGIACLGLGTALSAAPMMAVAADVARQGQGNTNSVVIVRLLERFGSFVGPMIAATAVALFDYRGAVIVIGVLGSGCALALLCSFLIRSKIREAS